MGMTSHSIQPSYAAIILAAGYSSRMQGHLKALLPLGSSPHIVHELIKNLRNAGINDIHIVVGHEHERITKAVNTLGARIVYNPDFATGMFSSVYAGVQSVMNNGTAQATYIVPVDAALIKSSSMKQMLALWHEEANPMRILIPCFLKRCGHPPLIGHGHFAKILQHQDAQGGLRGYFASYLSSKMHDDFLSGHAMSGLNVGDLGESCLDMADTDIVRFISLVDEGIVSDIDTMADYHEAEDFLQTTQNRRIPSLLEAWYLLQNAHLPDRIIGHSCQVAIGALRLGLALKRDEINPLYHMCAGLLHDIKRLEKNHAMVGQDFLQEMGWKEIGYIVGAHTVLPKSIHKAMHIDLQENAPQIASSPFEDPLYNDAACLYASICVYLADKLYTGEHCVSIPSRFAKVYEQFENDPLALQAIRQREKVALSVNDWFYSFASVDAYECVQTPSDHKFENRLLALLK